MNATASDTEGTAGRATVGADAGTSARSQAGASSRRGPVLAIAAVALGLAAIAFRELATYDPSRGAVADTEGVEHYLFAPTGSSPAMIFALTALLLYGRWRHLWGCLGAPSRPLPASALMIASGLIAGWGHYVGAADLVIVALSLCLAGAGWLLCGREGLRLVLPPALFLLLAITPPAVLLNQVLPSMQLVTANVAVAFLNAIGVESIAEGDLVYSTRGLFQVIETCSGWRALITLTMAAWVYAEMFRLGRVRYLALLAAAPFVAFVVNQIRVVSIVLNPTSHFAEVHETQGIVAIVLGVLGLAAVDALLARTIGDPGRPCFAARRAGPPPAAVPMRRLATVAASLAFAAAATTLVPAWESTEPRQPPLALLPVRIGDLQVSALPLEGQYLGSVYPEQWVHRSFAEPGEGGPPPVRVLLAGDRRLERGRSVLSDKVAWVGAGSAVVARTSTTIPGVDEPVEVMWVRRRGEHFLVYHWRDGAGSVASEIARAWAGLDRSAFRRPGRLVAVRIDTPFDPAGGTASRAAAAQRLDVVAREVAGFLSPG